MDARTTSDRPLHRARAGALDGMGSRGVPALARLRRRAADARGAIALMIPPDAWVADAPRRRAGRARRARAGRRRGHRPGLLRRRAPPEDDQHAPRPRPRRDRPGAARARARPAGARDLPRDAADERRAAAGRWSSTCPTTSATPTTAARSAPSTTPTTTCGSRPVRWPRVPAARSVTRPSPTITRRSTRWARASWPVGWSVLDELVEAIELPDARWALGVQWHPEVDPRSRVVRVLRGRGGPRPGPSDAPSARAPGE